MADRVAVSNLALSKLGEARQLIDPNEDTQAARSIAAVWEALRKATLRKGKFNFSIARVPLSAQAPSDPSYVTPFPFANRFPLPGDFIRLVELFDASGQLVEHYKIEGRAILTDAGGPLTLRYVADVVDPGQWDDLFVTAFAARLAFEIAEAITGDRGRKSDCWADFLAATRAAAGTDAKEDPPEDAFDGSWVTARYGSSGAVVPNV